VAIVDKFPGRKRLGSFKGLVDFYEWKGVKCARAWPIKPTNTKALIAAHKRLKSANEAWQSLSQVDRHAFNFMALYSDRSGRDLHHSYFLVKGRTPPIYYFKDLQVKKTEIRVRFELKQGGIPQIYYAYRPYLGPCMFVFFEFQAVRLSGGAYMARIYPNFRSVTKLLMEKHGVNILRWIPRKTGYLYFCLN